MAKPTREVHFLIGRLSGPVTDSFGLQTAISPSLRRRIADVMRNKQYESARNAILARVKDRAWLAALDGTGTPDPEMLTTLACAVLVSDHPKRPETRDWWAGQVGKSWKALRELPRRIEDIAQEIESVNGAELLAPENQVNGKSPNAHIARESFRDLPSMMRVWAKALQERMKVMPRLDAAVFGERTALDYLQWFVKQAAGKPCDPQVASLLNAAAIALGKAPRFDAQALAQARYRRKRTMPGI